MGRSGSFTGADDENALVKLKRDGDDARMAVVLISAETEIFTHIVGRRT